jgi:hypothetical protein
MMKRLAASAIGVVGVAAAFTVPSAVASGGDAQPTGMAYPQTIVAHGDDAVIYGNYSCTNGPGVLWASVKQGGSDLSGEGSSSRARSWFDTHVPLNCDGHRHNIRVVIDKEAPNDGHTDPYRNLRDGRGYVQWCVTDSRFDGTSETGLSSFSRWLQVEQAGPR